MFSLLEIRLQDEPLDRSGQEIHVEVGSVAKEPLYRSSTASEQASSHLNPEKCSKRVLRRFSRFYEGYTGPEVGSIDDHHLKLCWEVD